MQRRLYGISVLVLVLALGPRLWAKGSDAASVLQARETALAARALETSLDLFADEAVVVTSSGRLLKGRDQIRSWVQDQVERGQREEAGPRYQQGAKLSWPGKVYREDWQQMGIAPLEVTQDAIIRAGKIHFFNTTLTPESAARLEAARKRN